MATATINIPEQQMPSMAGGTAEAMMAMGGAPPQRGQETTEDDPNQKTPEENQAAAQLTDEEKDELMELRRKYKQRWAAERRAKVRHVRRTFEVLHNRPFSILNPDGFTFSDPFAQDFAGGTTGNEGDEDDLYRANDNIYQMLEGSFTAALARSQSNTRYQPDDADSEIDVATARRASDAMAYIERRNRVKKLGKLELKHLFTSGCYFSQTTYVVDGARAGTTKTPVYGMAPKEISPDHYACKKCGAEIPASAVSPFAKPTCPRCGYPLGQDDFYEAQSVPVPQIMGYKETPNGMVAINVWGALNVDADPFADELVETPILDLEVESHIAKIRSAYPEAWDKVGEAGGSTGSAEGDSDRANRLRSRSQSGNTLSPVQERMSTYSRCWIQPWAFNEIDDKEVAASLKSKFPDGCKLVSVGGETFLEARPDKLSDVWTHCAAQEGMGLYPPGVGDCALDIQDRINDVASIVHEYMDRLACGTVLVDEDAVSSKALSKKKLTPGTLIPIKRKTLNSRPMSDLVYQVEFKTDANIYQYGQNLVMLAQLIAGIRPEIFGGSDPNVKTAQGQQQQLNQAIGRLLLYLDQIHEEHANRSEVAVKCQQRNMDEDLRHVVEGDSDSGFANEYILLEEMQGSFHAYAESDQGFPASFSEMKQQVIEMLGEAKDNPLVQEVMQVADNQRIVAAYAAPPGIKLPQEDARAKYKRIIAQLATESPQETLGPAGPMYMPSVLPDKDVDDMALIRELVIEWAMRNYKLQYSRPANYENVKAYMRLAGQYAAERMAQQAVTERMAAGPQAAPPAAAAAT